MSLKNNLHGHEINKIEKTVFKEDNVVTAVIKLLFSYAWCIFTYYDIKVQQTTILTTMKGVKKNYKA